MTYNKPDTKLDECIYVAENIIPADLCDSIVKDIGRYGPYIKHGRINVTIPKKLSKDTITLDEALELLENKKQRSAKKGASKKKKGASKKKASKGKAKKKATSKNT